MRPQENNEEVYTSLATAIRNALHNVVGAAVRAMQDAARAAQESAPADHDAVQQRERTDDIVSGVLRGVLESLGPVLVQRLGVTIRQPNGTTVGATGQGGEPATESPAEGAAPGQPAPPSLQSFPVEDSDEEDVREPADKRHKPDSDAGGSAPVSADVPMRAPPADNAATAAPATAAPATAAPKPAAPVAKATPAAAGPSGLKGGLGKGLGPSLPPKRPAKRTPVAETTSDAARAGLCQVLS